MVKATRHKIKKYPDLKLYEEIIFLSEFFGGKWVIENVKPYYKPLIPPTFELSRHLFWCNFYIADFKLDMPKGFIRNATIEAADQMKQWLGIHFEGYIYYEGNHNPVQVLNNCVHPDLGLHILTHAAPNNTLHGIAQAGFNANIPRQQSLF